MIYSLDRLCGALTAPVVTTGQAGETGVGLVGYRPASTGGSGGILSLLAAVPRLVLPFSERGLLLPGIFLQLESSRNSSANKLGRGTVFLGVCWKFKLHHAGAVVSYSSLSD